MDFSQFLARYTHRPLAWLGKHRDWLLTSIAPDGSINYSFKFPDKDGSINKEDYTWLDEIRPAKTNSDHLLALFYRAAAASLSLGPKMFCPTAIQCEALENVDVEVPFEDYRQPYETLIIQLPEDYRRDAMRRMGLKLFPSYAMVHHDMRSNIITVASNYMQRAEGETVLAVLRPSPGSPTIEDEFHKEELRDEPLVDRLIQRLAINMCLLLTAYRTRQRPLDPEYMAKLRKLAKKQDKDKRDRAQNLLLGQVMVVEFEQQIQLHDVEEEKVEPGQITEVRERETHTVGPHWRRGHWRRQQHGARWLATHTENDGSAIIDETHHRVFIKPILVKSALFAGDKSQTSVFYQGGKSSPKGTTGEARQPSEPPQKDEYGG